MEVCDNNKLYLYIYINKEFLELFEKYFACEKITTLNDTYLKEPIQYGHHGRKTVTFSCLQIPEPELNGYATKIVDT